MSKSPLESKPISDYIRLLLGKRATNSQVVLALKKKFDINTTEASVRRFLDRHSEFDDLVLDRNITNGVYQQAEAEGAKFEGDEVVFTLKPTWKEIPVSQLEIDDLLQRHNLSPDEWEVKNILSNQWEMGVSWKNGGGKQILYQFKVWFKKKVALQLIYPATVGPKIAPPKDPDNTKPITTVVFNDQQCPFRDDGLHELFLRWLKTNKPDNGIVGGDLLDNGYISRHRDNPAWHSSVQGCVQSAFDTLYDYRNANTSTKWYLLKGNHDDRIRNEQLERNERLYGVTAAQYPGDEPEEWVYSLNHLLHLDRLGIEYVEPQGTYEFEQIPITSLIAARHGHKTGQGAPLNTALQLGHSIVLGHLHRQSITKKTVWNSITNQWHVITAIEAGCACKIEGGLGFASGGTPDWQPGFAVITSWPDGNFTADLGNYEQSGILRFRDQLYRL